MWRRLWAGRGRAHEWRTADPLYLEKSDVLGEDVVRGGPITSRPSLAVDGARHPSG
jgi:hypothetical protein